MKDQSRSWRATLEDTSVLGRDLARFIHSRRLAGGIGNANKVTYPRNNWAETDVGPQQRRIDTSTERTQRILRLQKEIAAEGYRVPAADLADRMMTAMRRDL